MSAIVIRVDGISKRYRIGGQQERLRTLRETLTASAAAPLRRARAALDRMRGRRRPAPSAPCVWALDDISFEVRVGEVVGLIGRNGAGKSTLLKVLSRITTPTSGRAEIHGRVGSLLEVGTGFHPELTGRENIYLNGAVLGMRRAEIQRKFDEIVAFAEVERFIDTPVKHYSTGMYLRLAFSVAAHLEPEILLVDEVLAVGDAAFQKKCLGKMGDVAQEGRTVLFVSHNMAAIQSLCGKGVLLDGGRVRVAGDLPGVMRSYYEILNSAQPGAATAAEVELLGIRINGQTSPSLPAGAPVRFEFDLVLHSPVCGFRLFWIIESPQGYLLLHSVVNEQALAGVAGPGAYRICVAVPRLWLASGVYTVYAKMICNSVDMRGRYFSDKSLLVVESSYDPGSAVGLLDPPVAWTVQPLAETICASPVC